MLLNFSLPKVLSSVELGRAEKVSNIITPIALIGGLISYGNRLYKLNSIKAELKQEILRQQSESKE
jgi:hypothetical protein